MVFMYLAHSGRDGAAGGAGGSGGVGAAEWPTAVGTDDDADAGTTVGTSGSRVVMRKGPSWNMVRSSRVSAGGL